MPDCYSSSGYLELFQFFLGFSEDQWPREQPEWCSRRPSQLQPPEHHSPAKWCRVPSPTVTERSQAEEHQTQKLILCCHFDGTDLCQLSYESQVAGQTWFDSWETGATPAFRFCLNNSRPAPSTSSARETGTHVSNTCMPEHTYELHVQAEK